MYAPSSFLFYFYKTDILLIFIPAQLLLSNLVNKMGDPSKKIASKSMHCLTQVLMKHPNMKGVIMDEVEKLLFR